MEQWVLTAGRGGRQSGRRSARWTPSDFNGAWCGRANGDNAEETIHHRSTAPLFLTRRPESRNPGALSVMEPQWSQESDASATEPFVNCYR